MTDAVKHRRITAEEVRNLFAYDANTGEFRRLFSGGGRRAGSIAGTTNTNGYCQISVKGVHVYAHRLAWLYVYGEFPECDIDHIDGNRSNNRISNLREANRSENNQNRRKARIDSTSGMLGVIFHSARNRWQARIHVNGKTKSLGYYDAPSEAHEAYLQAKRALHPFQQITGASNV